MLPYLTNMIKCLSYTNKEQRALWQGDINEMQEKERGALGTVSALWAL